MARVLYENQWNFSTSATTALIRRADRIDSGEFAPGNRVFCDKEGEKLRAEIGFDTQCVHYLVIHEISSIFVSKVDLVFISFNLLSKFQISFILKFTFSK